MDNNVMNPSVIQTTAALEKITETAEDKQTSSR
jgi:hypothetical protein